MVMAADYPFLEILGTMAAFFLFVVWFFLLIKVFADVFRREDIGGASKFFWTLFVLVVPYLGVLVYLIAQGKAMGRRDVKDAQERKAEVDAYIREVARGE